MPEADKTYFGFYFEKQLNAFKRFPFGFVSGMHHVKTTLDATVLEANKMLENRGLKRRDIGEYDM